VKINVDDRPQLASQYGVQGIPALMLFHRGKILWRVAGAAPYEQIRSEVEKNIPR
jgi:thioredoxin-like negative regulator of GroEL